MDTLELSSPKNPAILYLGRALRAPGLKARSLTISVKMKLAFSRGKLIGSLRVMCPPCDRAWWVCLQKNRWEIMLDLYCMNLTIFLTFSIFQCFYFLFRQMALDLEVANSVFGRCPSFGNHVFKFQAFLFLNRSFFM